MIETIVNLVDNKLKIKLHLRFSTLFFSKKRLKEVMLL